MELQNLIGLNQLKVVEVDFGYEFYNKGKSKIAYLSTQYAHLGVFNDNYFGEVTADELKFIMANYYPRLIKENRLSKKLCNVKELQGTAFNEINDWFIEKLVPLLVDAGMKYNAIVVPEEFYAQLVIDLYQGELKPDLKKSENYFNSVESALDWLNSID